MLDSIKIKLQYLLPKQALTRLAGWAADKQGGWLTQSVIKGFARYYGINMQEALYPDPAHYKTFNDFFVRPLRDGVRPIAEFDDGVVLPADGAISQLGPIEAGRLLQAKGHDYTLEALLAGQYQLAQEFTSGQFVTTYLSPRDYHRVHMPCDGRLREMIYVPGDLFSVNPLTAANVANLFARNERLICIFDTAVGPLAQILVGATIVGSIETVWSGCVNPERAGIIRRWTYPSEGDGVITLKKGQEMGRFKLGSTVINLFAAGRIQFDAALSAGSITRMGRELGHVPTATHAAQPATE
ncbi:Phosphatidylserine decarboxylase proenzyme [Edwardsiella tarda]|uniref:Archaetidylserine decarboxylase n=1 Tax=Edwardsiella tarda ATCC 15947 = NBRC 105688 TaxID=667121 RepID=A0AC61TGS4_EDWTA|nr:archaetidylserine decarboxylase [Edwardsiella tarda]UAL57040.1 archaetidylserine decarboxylase [Edwardsiella tarda]UCP99905.1 archaetidylserine decarboxylase [Edwardsiella tarda ATCC 15947 = NBRC 105688]STD31125.1 Phosphatidylserine decarboxylase proenzyme [Edwardsiella tarda]